MFVKPNHEVATVCNKTSPRKIVRRAKLNDVAKTTESAKVVVTKENCLAVFRIYIIYQKTTLLMKSICDVYNYEF